MLQVGVLRVLYHEHEMSDNRTLDELVRSSRLLSEVMRPSYPVELIANLRALTDLNSHSALGRAEIRKLDFLRVLEVSVRRNSRNARVEQRARRQSTLTAVSIDRNGSNWLQDWEDSTGHFWDISAPELDGSHAATNLEEQGSKQNPHLSCFACLFKLHALSGTRFSKTLFLDADLFVLHPQLVGRLLTTTLDVADIAMPLDPGV